MKQILRKIELEEQGVRLDAFLAQEAQLTRSRIQSLLSQGQVLLNGTFPQKAGVMLRVGDLVELHVPAAVPATAQAERIPLDIVYQDEDIIVVNKQRGLVVHPAAGHESGTLVNALLAACEDLSGIGGELRPGIVHRLDKDTTGLLVAAKNDMAHNALSEQMKDRSAGREYCALVHGSFREPEGEMISLIGRHPKDRKRMAVVDAGGREAITKWWTICHLRESTLLRVKLLTGRTHQIRVHMSHNGHYILGDPIYGAKNDKTPVLMLHAAKLAFYHPRDGQPMTFEAPLPDDYLEQLRIRGYTAE